MARARRGDDARLGRDCPRGRSTDPEVLRAALIREPPSAAAANACAGMQAEVVQLAVDLLVQQPDIEGFFGALTKTMVEDGEGTPAASG